MLLVCMVLTFVKILNAQDLSTAVDVKTLSELPLNKLLNVRNSFEIDNNDLSNLIAQDRSDEKYPGAMALRRGKPKAYNSRGDWDDEKGSKKGMQSVFQMSVTALAFLAFGGYLLCLIVQSLKDKGGHHKVVVVWPGTTAAPVTMMTMMRRRRRRRRPLRNRRRPAANADSTRYKRSPTDGPTVGMFPSADPEKMFDALITLSEAYTHYHTVDYKQFNHTSSRF